MYECLLVKREAWKRDARFCLYYARFVRAFGVIPGNMEVMQAVRV